MKKLDLQALADSFGLKEQEIVADLNMLFGAAFEQSKPVRLDLKIGTLIVRTTALGETINEK